MKIGDQYVWKTKIGNAGDSLIWQVHSFECTGKLVMLRHVWLSGLDTTMWVNIVDIPKCFVKVGPDGRLIQTEEDEQDWFGYMLPEGMQSKQENAVNCYHEWKEYIGFRESFTYCVKCDKKRE